MGMLLINSLEPGATLHDGISFYRKQKKQPDSGLLLLG